MSAEYASANEANDGNLIANVNVYWRVSALALAAVALLGIGLSAYAASVGPDKFPYLIHEDFLRFDWAHNITHVLLAGIAGAFGFTALRDKQVLSRRVAATVGVVYLGLGVLGFVPAVTDLLESTLGLGLEVGENLVHLTLGAWGAYAGFSG